MREPSSAGLADTEAAYAVLSSRHADFSAAEIGDAAGLSPDAVAQALGELVKEHRAAALAADRYLSDLAAKRLMETARRIAAAFHKQNPLRRALPTENLPAPLQKAAACRDFGAVLGWLMEEGILVAEGTGGVRLPDHRVIMPTGWRTAADEILAVYLAAGLQPPLPGNFRANYPRDVSVPGILGVLVETGELVEIEDRMYVSSQAIEETKAAIRRLSQTPEGITVGAVRNATESSRRVILPLLEYLDAQGFTRRNGEKRELAEVGGG
ncbi:MAG: SelB C-terminal domain-containing protein [Cytophagales bacterium]|nr:SelB C-terminal domain-containing protein [Armatimonadota bacterium]